MEQEVLLELKNVSTHFKVRGGVLKAVNGVSLQIHKGETVGLVGESGCGKTTTVPLCAFTSLRRARSFTRVRMCGPTIRRKQSSIAKMCR